MYFEFPGEKLFPRRSHFRREAFSGEKPFKKTLLPLPCKECSKSFSESESLKTLIQKKSHLLYFTFIMGGDNWDCVCVTWHPPAGADIKFQTWVCFLSCVRPITEKNDLSCDTVPELFNFHQDAT